MRLFEVPKWWRFFFSFPRRASFTDRSWDSCTDHPRQGVQGRLPVFFLFHDRFFLHSLNPSNPITSFTTFHPTKTKPLLPPFLSPPVCTNKSLKLRDTKPSTRRGVGGGWGGLGWWYDFLFFCAAQVTR